jgi:hypothetical protein
VQTKRKLTFTLPSSQQTLTFTTILAPPYVSKVPRKRHSARLNKERTVEKFSATVLSDTSGKEPDDSSQPSGSDYVQFCLLALGKGLFKISLFETL